MKKYDAILCVQEPINEGGYDDRRYATKNPQGNDRGLISPYVNYDDPKMYANFSFGQTLQSRLNDMGKEYSAKVTDFGKWVVAEVSHVNVVTGRSSSKTFLIVFQNKGDGMVLSTHNKYRTISGVEQAASYIRSAASALQSADANKI